MDLTYPAFRRPLSLEDYGPASFPVQSLPAVPPVLSTPAMSQRTQFIASQNSVAHIAGERPVIQRLPYVLPQPASFHRPSDPGVASNERSARHRRTAEAQRQYRERRKRVEQERDAEVAALKSKVQYLIALLKSRYSHDPSLELQLIPPGASIDVLLSLLGGPNPSNMTTSDYAGASCAGPATVPLHHTTSQMTIGADPQAYLHAHWNTSDSSNQQFFNKASAIPPYCSMYDGGSVHSAFNFPTQS